MPISTKSIEEPAQRTDGLRICIMRRPGEYTEWDLWMPKLSPPDALLDAYKKEGLPWKEFKKKFSVAVLYRQRRLIELLAILSQHTKITLLCVEADETFCHRSLVRVACERAATRLEERTSSVKKG